MKGVVCGATFRDPAGSLSLEGKVAVRRIHEPARAEVLAFVGSEICRRMQARGDLIEAEVEDGPEGLRLVHPRVAVSTYPWEWTAPQWMAAGELTLGLCEEALGQGWILKDATPLNVLFVGARPVLVDILSFERCVPGAPIWLAYGQYVRTFLLPLVMYRLRGWPLAMSVFRRDGYEPAELYAALGWGGRLSWEALWPITVPALLERRRGADAEAVKQAGRMMEPEAAAYVLRRTLKDLRGRTQRAVRAGRASEWSEYQGTLRHYTAEESARKREWVQGVLGETQPPWVLDVGANTGEFSRLAAEMGAQVVALERDGEAAERIYLMSRESGLAVQTIHADLARPTPAVGWENAESGALLERLEGQFELVMLLAVIHHLLLLEQIPLAAIVGLCHRLTRRHLMVEWVPVEDPMFQSLMRGRVSLYGWLREEDLLAACAGRFRMVQRQVLTNWRVLLLFERV